MTFPFDDYFTEYKKLGGKKTKKQYMENIDRNFNLFLLNKQIAKISYNELDLIFHSIDNITSYT